MFDAVFDAVYKLFYPLSLLLQWNMLCLTDHLVPVPQSFFFGGCVLGSLLSGIVSYCFGRRIGLHITIFFMAAFGVLSGLAVVFSMYVFTRFFVGVFVQMSLLISHTWILELTPPENRGYAPSYTALFSIAGAAWLPFVSSVLPDWRWFEGFLSLLALVPLFYLW